MTDAEFDKLLRAALMEAVRLDFQPVMEAAEQEEIIFSRRYLNRREKMLQDPFAYAKKAGLSLWQRAARTVAMILLVCSILFAAAMTVPEVRAAIRKLYMEWYETYIAVYVQDDTGAGETDLSKFHVEIPADVLPEGYEESLRMKRAGIIRYSNEEGDVISVEYRNHIGQHMMETDSMTKAAHQRSKNGITYYLTTTEEPTRTNHILWIQPTFDLLIDITAPYETGADALIEIAQHILVDKK